MSQASDEYRLLSAHIDVAFYLRTYPDVADAGVDPIAHFISQGWREGRNPSPAFNVAYYLRVNADVAAAGINPLLHYVHAGKQEGRAARRAFDEERSVLEAASPQRLAGVWADEPDPKPDLSLAKITRLLAQQVRPGGSLIIAFSHDDAECNVGGVQNLVREERAAFCNRGFSYLSVCPQRPRSFHPYGLSEQVTYSVRLDGTRLGAVRASDLLQALRQRVSAPPPLIIVHHLQQHVPEVVELFLGLAPVATIFWAHDFAAACPSYNLLRNDLTFCGGPPDGAGACSVCAYGAERAKARPRMQRFFAAARPQIIAPSQSALSTWLSATKLPHRGAAVQSLARLVVSGSVSRSAPSQPFRVGFLGAPLVSKGWLAFARLVAAFRGDPRYRFFQLGHTPGALAGVSHVPVSATREQPNAMIDALAERRIDVVVNWPAWPETFSYTALEAMAAGASVITHADSGNVGALIRETPSRGLIMTDEPQLHACFREGELGPLLSASDRRRGVIVREGGTAAWLQQTREGRSILGQLVPGEPRPSAAVDEVVAHG